MDTDRKVKNLLFLKIKCANGNHKTEGANVLDILDEKRSACLVGECKYVEKGKLM